MPRLCRGLPHTSYTTSRVLSASIAAADYHMATVGWPGQTSRLPGHKRVGRLPAASGDQFLGKAQEVPGGGEVGDGGVVGVSGPGPHGGHQHRGQVQEEAYLRHRQERELETETGVRGYLQQCGEQIEEEKRAFKSSFVGWQEVAETHMSDYNYAALVRAKEKNQILSQSSPENRQLLTQTTFRADISSFN